MGCLKTERGELTAHKVCAGTLRALWFVVRGVGSDSVDFVRTCESVDFCLLTDSNSEFFPRTFASVAAGSGAPHLRLPPIGWACLVKDILVRLNYDQ